jgi:hypothetical protein
MDKEHIQNEEFKLSFPEALKRYIMLELHCDMTQCKPCSFPECPLLEKRRVEEPETKTVELSDGSRHVEVEGTTIVKDKVKRYLMVELSCDGTACSPCTYPNCQRFSRDMKLEMGEKFKKPNVKRVLSIDKNGNLID